MQTRQGFAVLNTLGGSIFGIAIDEDSTLLIFEQKEIHSLAGRPLRA
jgi:hypothetical protein